MPNYKRRFVTGRAKKKQNACQEVMIRGDSSETFSCMKGGYYYVPEVKVLKSWVYNILRDFTVIEWLSTGWALHSLLITACPPLPTPKPPCIETHTHTHNTESLRSYGRSAGSGVSRRRMPDDPRKPLEDDFSLMKASLQGGTA